MPRDPIFNKLLKMPERAGTVLPELHAFFGDDRFADDELERYIRTFAGTTITVPDPKLIEDLDIDVAIAKALRGQPSPGDRIRICLRYGVPYKHLCTVYRAAYDRDILEPQHAGTRASKIEAAASLLLEEPRADKLVIEMFNLDPEDIREVRAKRDED